VWLREGSMLDAVRASIAFPGLFTPAVHGGRRLVDGGLTNPVPVSVCRALGARLVIAVNLNADAFGKPTVETEGEELLHELDEATKQSGNLIDRVKPTNMIMRQLFGHGKNTPGMLSNMLAALNIVQDRLSRSRLAGDPPDVMVSPRLGHVGLLEFEKAEECIDEGMRAMEEAQPFLNGALSVLGNWPGPHHRMT
jgi:NTE family protein